MDEMQSSISAGPPNSHQPNPIVRAFVKLREFLATHKGLAEKIEAIARPIGFLAEQEKK